MLITNILSFLFIITILVVIHELGHFLAAKSIGLKVEKFYVGFNLFGLGLKKKINDTEFGIGLFPIGGYVKVAGMVDESLDDEYKGKDDEYISKSMLQKVWFTSGGVIFNFILAFILFTSIIYIDGYSIIRDEPVLGNVVEEKPADLLGLENGDVITKLNNTEIYTWGDLSKYIHSRPSTKISISWNRSGEILSDSILVGSMISPYGDSLGIIGIEPIYDQKSAGILTAISRGFNQTFNWLVIMSYSIFSFFTGQLGVENFGGPIQIASITALEADQKCVSDIRDMYCGRRDVLCDGLNSMGWNVDKPKGTMFVWAPIPEQFKEMGSLEFSKKVLIEAKVAVSPGIGFGSYGDNFVRFALIENEHRTRQALRAIRSMLREENPKANAG